MMNRLARNDFRLGNKVATAKCSSSMRRRCVLTKSSVKSRNLITNTWFTNPIRNGSEYALNSSQYLVFFYHAYIASSKQFWEIFNFRVE